MRRCILPVALTLALLSAVPGAEASLMVIATESGSDVVFSGSGSINLSGAKFVGTLTGPNVPVSYVQGQYGTVVVGGTDSTLSEDQYEGVIGPTSLGFGGPVLTSVSSGDRVGFSAWADLFLVPHGYSSGDPLAFSSTFTNRTLDSMGLTPGTYLYKLPSDLITLQIRRSSVGDNAVPEPATLTMVAIGAASVGLVARRRRTGR